MRLSTRRSAAALGAAVLVGSALAATPATASGASEAAASGETLTYVVLADTDAADATVRASIEAAGGTVTDVNAAVGMYTVTASAAGFTMTVADEAGISGATTNSVIGHAVPDHAKKDREVEKLPQERTGDGWAPPPGNKTGHDTGKGNNKPAPEAPEGDTLSDRQWDMDMIGAPQAHAIETGEGVRVGIMDTGVDASHPDIAPNFNHELSRNFTTDIPLVDGPCEEEPDASCEDPADVDPYGHGTHVAGSIAAAKNGRGIVGIAPDAEIINLRAGQDSGYFFLEATVDALTYAPTIGVDVVNMSFYIDPWLFNCANNPADSPEAQMQQRTTIEATNRALDYARDRGVTLVAAAGNGHTDLDNPTFDGSSPDFPPGTSYPREIDNSCLDLPAEGDGVVAVSSVGPSTIKAYYSNWGTEEITVAAPGGAYYDVVDGQIDIGPENLVLSTVPKGSIDPALIDPETGMVDDPSGFVVSECPDGPDSCAYYDSYQGTSMASPHAAGVVALIVGRWGHPTPQTGGVGLSPHQAEKILTATATETACPAEVYDYPAPIPASYNSNCDGNLQFNGWYGNGIVDALGAVMKKH